MSYRIGLDVLNLRPAERIGRTEYCFHNEFIRKITGLDPASPDPLEQKEAKKRLLRWVDYDFMWCTGDSSVAWENRGRITRLGHAEYVENGTDLDTRVSCPFKDIDEALNFDAVQEYGMPDRQGEVAEFRKLIAPIQADFSETVVPGGYYHTLISGCIATFGWDLLLEAMGTDAARFGEYVLEGYFQLTYNSVAAWAQTDIKAFIQHDDIVWTEGAIFQPDWYRRYVFPRYQKLWRPLKEAGIKVLFCSDGNYTEFVDDIAAAGADGFIFEPMTDLELIVRKYGRTHVIVGNADCRPMTFGTKADVEREVKRCMETAKACPGFIMATGNHLPANIPLDNIEFYFDLVKKYQKR